MNRESVPISMQHSAQKKGSVRSTRNSDKDKPDSQNDAKHKTEPGLDDGIQLGEGYQAPRAQRRSHRQESTQPQQRHGRRRGRRMYRSRQAQTRSPPRHATKAEKRPQHGTQEKGGGMSSPLAPRPSIYKPPRAAARRHRF